MSNPLGRVFREGTVVREDWLLEGGVHSSELSNLNRAARHYLIRLVEPAFLWSFIPHRAQDAVARCKWE